MCTLPEQLVGNKEIRTCAYQGGKKCSFFGKLGVLCFLETSVLRFAFLSYYRRLDLDSLPRSMTPKNKNIYKKYFCLKMVPPLIIH